MTAIVGYVIRRDVAAANGMDTLTQWVASPGYRVFTGMFKNRRVDPRRSRTPTLTRDRAEAFTFRRRDYANEQIARYYARIEGQFTIERVTA